MLYSSVRSRLRRAPISVSRSLMEIATLPTVAAGFAGSAAEAASTPIISTARVMERVVFIVSPLCVSGAGARPAPPMGMSVQLAGTTVVTVTGVQRVQLTVRTVAVATIGVEATL